MRIPIPWELEELTVKSLDAAHTLSPPALNMAAPSIFPVEIRLEVRGSDCQRELFRTQPHSTLHGRLWW